VEKNKSETADLLNDEYTEKAIMFGYVMVLKFYSNFKFWYIFIINLLAICMLTLSWSIDISIDNYSRD